MVCISLNNIDGDKHVQAFPAGDVALHKILGVQGLKHPARLAEAAALAWKPWRSYAVIRTWSGSWRGAES